MKRHLNTLFVTLDGAWLSKDGEAVDVRFEKESKLRVPLHNLDGIVTLGWDIQCSSALLAACAEAGVTVSFCNPYGKFLAASVGFTPGNVLLRRQQYRASDDPVLSVAIAREVVAAKIANSRTVLLRAVRDHDRTSLQTAALALANRAQTARQCTDMDILRGVEGDAADL